MIYLERNEPTAEGVNRFAQVKSEDLQKWLDTGKWKRRDLTPEDIAEKNEIVEKLNGEIDNVEDVVEPKKRGRKPKNKDNE